MWLIFMELTQFWDTCPIFAILDKLYFKHCKDSSIGYFKLPSGSNLRSADIQDGWPVSLAMLNLDEVADGPIKFFVFQFRIPALVPFLL